MEALIKRLEKVPVSIEALRRVVPNHTVCKLYTELTQPLFPKGKCPGSALFAIVRFAKCVANVSNKTKR